MSGTPEMTPRETREVIMKELRAEIGVTALRFRAEFSHMQRLAHAVAVASGWWESDVPFPTSVANFHGEVSEIWESYRSGHELAKIYDGAISESGQRKPEGIPVEMADLLIRMMDTAGAHSIDIAAALVEKMLYNTYRSYRHGGKRA